MEDVRDVPAVVQVAVKIHVATFVQRHAQIIAMEGVLPHVEDHVPM